MELTHLRNKASSTETPWRRDGEVPKGGRSERDIRNEGRWRSVREIAWELDISRNTARRHLNAREALVPKPRTRRASKLYAYRQYIDRLLSKGLENCTALWRELQGLGHQGGYSILKSCV